MGPADFVTIWLLVTDQGKNDLTFVDVTKDFTIMDLENQSGRVITVVTELHGGCRSTHSLKTAGNVGISSWRGGWGWRGDLGAGAALPTLSILPTALFVALCIQSVVCRQESVRR